MILIHYQMYTEGWEYAPNDKGEGIGYGHVDCSGIHGLGRVHTIDNSKNCSNKSKDV